MVVVGGGIAGSVAARYTARNGFETLLLEGKATPRNKPCSGVQLPYMERLLGTDIPRDVLCRNQLSKVVITTPKGRELSGRLPMLNYWRRDFDAWLNKLAVDAGAEFRDSTRVEGIKWNHNEIKVDLGRTEVTTRYLVGADGLSPYSITRRSLRPEDFGEKTTATAINYYFKGEGDVDPRTLYVFYRRQFSNLMFSWLYYKDNEIVIGSSSEENPKTCADSFYKYIKEKFRLRGEIDHKEGYSTTFLGGIFLGKDKLLLAGDAAGLLDLYRGVGMDTAALSGRLASMAILKSTEGSGTAIDHYNHLSRHLVKTINDNNEKQKERYRSNYKIEESLSLLNILKGKAYMTYAQLMNKILPIEKTILLPP